MMASRTPLTPKTNVRPVSPASKSPIATTQQIHLPRVLPRPSRSEVDASKIAAASPELQNVSPEYIREKLLTMTPQMYQSLSDVQATPPKHALPKELEMIINDATCCPTHMLAVWSSSPQPNEMCQITMYPTHHLVLASHCANLPVLPPSCPSSSSSTVMIPVVSLCIPSPPTFPLLHSYLYTKDIGDLASALFLPSDPDAPNRQVALVYGVWSNAHALGVVDGKLFNVLDKAWELVSAQSQVSP